MGGHKREEETNTNLTCIPSLSSEASRSLDKPDPPPDPPVRSIPISSNCKPTQDPTRLPSFPTRKELNRCVSCRRKVGLTGFRCRCGELFCTEHRYSDRHDCSFDYKAAGREAIARDNPVVRPAKLLKV